MRVKDEAKAIEKNKEGEIEKQEREKMRWGEAERGRKILNYQ